MDGLSGAVVTDMRKYDDIPEWFCLPKVEDYKGFVDAPFTVAFIEDESGKVVPCYHIPCNMCGLRQSYLMSRDKPGFDFIFEGEDGDCTCLTDHLTPKYQRDYSDEVYGIFEYWRGA